MKIKTKINLQKEIEVEIKIPYFCKSGNGRVFYKVMNKQGHFITINTYDFIRKVEFLTYLNELTVFSDGNVEITEEEFNKVFDDTLEFLKNKK